MNLVEIFNRERPDIGVYVRVGSTNRHADREMVDALPRFARGEAFDELGLIEQWGSGIQRMMAACHDAGMAPPALQEIGTRFRVTLFTARYGALRLDPTDQGILDALSGGEGKSTQQKRVATSQIKSIYLMYIFY